MQFNKKMGTTALAVSLVMATTLVGCSKDSNSDSAANAVHATNGGTANNASTDAKANNASTDAKANNATPDAAPSLDPVELSIYYPGGEQKDVAAVEEEMNKQLKDKINATVKIHAVDWGNWDQKINLMVASGEPFDLVWTGSGDYSVNVAKGAFTDLTDLLDKDAPELKAQINPVLLSGTQINGKNYAIPIEKELAEQFGVMLNKDLVDKYQFDLSTVKTLADLEPMLQTIKDKETGVVPFWGSKNVTTLIPYEQNGSDPVPGVIPLDGTTKVVDQWETPEMLQLLKTMKEWNQKGFFQQDPATQKDSTANDQAGTVFAEWSQLTPGKDKVLSQGWGHPLVQVALSEPYTTSADLSGSMTAISRTSKNPDRAMMLINLLHTDAQLLNTLVNGVEGKHFVKVSDNVIKLPDGVQAGQSAYAPGNSWQEGNQFLDYLWDNEDSQKWEAYKAFNASAKPSPIVGFTFNADPVKNEEAAINNVYNAYIDGLATGTIDYEKVLPDFVDKMKKAGLEKVIAERQKQIDAFLANKG
ncbi:ABC transporter substrate-binding protein [Paenibacillus rhizovicinus]|uniref:ABC transporter substrate-binding protein n=1 Tax=Paenibacillus rhizovicinus TaxID=2704463 RepID=A0A6C0P6V9_9BACL|nr:ABC transporter substrate-binding protein [Paenibacillus rhizovicinus]QHW33443.1 ABC transporter substrate-binding protein [Paenibacillus rhizovicinus]